MALLCCTVAYCCRILRLLLFPQVASVSMVVAYCNIASSSVVVIYYRLTHSIVSYSVVFCCSPLLFFVCFNILSHESISSCSLVVLCWIVFNCLILHCFLLFPHIVSLPYIASYFIVVTCCSVFYCYPILSRTPGRLLFHIALCSDVLYHCIVFC